MRRNTAGAIGPTLVFAASAALAACEHSATTGAAWPEINPGCERVTLYFDEAAPPHPYTKLRDFAGSWDEPDKDLRHWLINKACAIGADAVIHVVETRGHDEDGPIWNIRGDAVVYQR